MATDREIVEKLAGMDPRTDGQYWPTVCYFCSADLDRVKGRGGQDDLAEHEPDCLWRVACEHAQGRDAKNF